MRSRLARRSGSAASEHESLVGVVVPAYNSAAFLGETLDCLARQTFTGWTCVIVDDGSTDDTAVLAKKFVQQDERFRHQAQRNAGSAAARNAGFAALASRYVQFLDADDLLAPEKFERQVTVMEADPGLGVSYSNYTLLDSATGELTGRRFAEMRPGAESLEDFLYQWERGLTIPINAALFRATCGQRQSV